MSPLHVHRPLQSEPLSAANQGSWAKDYTALMLHILQVFKQQWEGNGDESQRRADNKQCYHSTSLSLSLSLTQLSLSFLLSLLPYHFPEQNKLGEVGQEISSQKQKQSNMKSSEGWKREGEEVLRG